MPGAAQPVPGLEFAAQPPGSFRVPHPPHPHLHPRRSADDVLVEEWVEVRVEEWSSVNDAVEPRWARTRMPFCGNMSPRRVAE